KAVLTPPVQTTDQLLDLKTQRCQFVGPLSRAVAAYAIAVADINLVLRKGGRRRRIHGAMGERDGPWNMPQPVMLRGSSVDDHDALFFSQQIGGQIRRVGAKS